MDTGLESAVEAAQGITEASGEMKINERMVLANITVKDDEAKITLTTEDLSSGTAFLRLLGQAGRIDFVLEDEGAALRFTALLYRLSIDHKGEARVVLLVEPRDLVSSLVARVNSVVVVMQA